MKKLKDYIFTTEFRILSGMIVGAAILFCGSAAWVVTQNKPASEYFVFLLASMAALGMVISSVLSIKYKESPRPGLPSIKGARAVIIGTFSLLIFGCLFVVALYLGLESLFQW